MSDERNTLANHATTQPCVTHRVLSPKLLLAMVVFDSLAIDGTFKWLMSQQPLGQSVVILPQYLSLQHLENTGMAFSILQANPLWASILSFTFLAILIVLVLQHRLTDRFEAVGFALMIGGGLNNALDRLFTGAVTDYIDMPFLTLPVFNLSDAFIFIGARLIGYHYFFVHYKAVEESSRP